MALSVLQVAVGGFDDNFSYLILDDVTKQAFVVDPSGSYDMLREQIIESGAQIAGILLTHTHQDHQDALPETLVDFDVPVYVEESGAARVLVTAEISVLHDGDTLSLGESTFLVMATPGHISDAVCFYIEKEVSESGAPLLITGDTLFVEGCGRTNRDDVEVLYHSLQRIAELPDETMIYPGHDYGPTPTSTLAHEKTHNRFYQARDLMAFIKERLG